MTRNKIYIAHMAEITAQNAGNENTHLAYKAKQRRTELRMFLKTQVPVIFIK